MTAAIQSLMAALLAIAALSGGSAAAEDHNVLTPQEKSAGWRLLFDGKTLNGWREFKKTSIGPGWTVRDGELTLSDPAAADDIITLDRYANFDLQFDWKISARGNSGVYYHVIEAGDHGYESGPEYQLLDNAHGEAPPERAGAVYALYPPSSDAVKPVGEFNHARIIVDHGHVQHWMNGVKVVEYELGSEDFKARVARSKFAKWPDFATASAGYISLQDHHSVVAFRDIKIRPLD